MTTKVTAAETAAQKEYAEKVRELNSARELPPIAHVHSFGCQQNVSDGEKIKGMLAMMGYGFSDSADGADSALYGDIRAHSAKLVNIAEAVVENAFRYHAGTLCTCQDCRHLGLHIRRETRVRVGLYAGSKVLRTADNSYRVVELLDLHAYLN